MCIILTWNVYTIVIQNDEEAILVLKSILHKYVKWHSGSCLKLNHRSFKLLDTKRCYISIKGCFFFNKIWHEELISLQESRHRSRKLPRRWCQLRFQRQTCEETWFHRHQKISVKKHCLNVWREDRGSINNFSFFCRTRGSAGRGFSYHSLCCTDHAGHRSSERAGRPRQQLSSGESSGICEWSSNKLAKSLGSGDDSASASQRRRSSQQSAGRITWPQRSRVGHNMFVRS